MIVGCEASKIAEIKKGKNEQEKTDKRLQAKERRSVPRTLHRLCKMGKVGIFLRKRQSIPWEIETFTLQTRHISQGRREEMIIDRSEKAKTNLACTRGARSKVLF